MFRGLNAINLDSKGRLSLPTKYRTIDEEGSAKSLSFVVTIDTEEPCLLMYPQAHWVEIEQRIEALPSFNRATRRIQRLLIGHATEIETDSQGRLLLPPLLREYAGLDKHVMLVGQGKKFEIWDEDRWHHGRALWLEEESQQRDELPTELQTISL